MDHQKIACGAQFCLTNRYERLQISQKKIAPAAGSPPKLSNLRQSFLAKIHTRTRQQAKTVVPEPQTSAVGSLKQIRIIRFDAAWQTPILSVGCASWSQ